MQEGRATAAAVAARHGGRGGGGEGGARQGDRGRGGAPGLALARQRRRGHHVGPRGAAGESQLTSLNLPQDNTRNLFVRILLALALFVSVQHTHLGG